MSAARDARICSGSAHEDALDAGPAGDRELFGTPHEVFRDGETDWYHRVLDLADREHMVGTVEDQIELKAASWIAADPGAAPVADPTGSEDVCNAPCLR